jgi:hypothetical protein
MGGMCTSMLRSERMERARGFSTEGFAGKKQHEGKEEGERAGRKPSRDEEQFTRRSSDGSSSSEANRSTGAAHHASEGPVEYVSGAHGRKRAPIYSHGARSNPQPQTPNPKT